MTRYRLTDLPTSPIRGSDKLIINRLNVSHKIDASDLVYFLAQIEFPITEKCLLDTDCPDGFVCIDGECQRLACDEDDFCPTGYTCINGYCFKLCSTLEPCGEGYICVDYLDDNTPICLPYPFPCDSENGCPPGFECYEGFCLQTCSGVGTCPEGTECVPVEIITDNGLETRNYCVPYPFPCGSVGNYPNNNGCPPGFYCYGGSCYPLCTGTGQGSCDDGFECIQVDQDSNGNPITICYPESPTEKLVNDGKLNFIDDSGDYLTVFTANQYGDTFLRFEGIDIDPGSEEGGGDGATITFNTLWQRTDVKVRESDIQPTYENVDVLPHGTSSKIGNTTNRWDGLFTHDLYIDRDVIGTLKPNPTLGYDLGSGQQRWGTTFTQDLNITQHVIGTLRPSAEKLYSIGEENKRWKSGHFGDSGGIQLNDNGSIGLPTVNDVGTKNMILTSKGNGQAVWEWIHFESQDELVFKVAQNNMVGSYDPQSGVTPGQSAADGVFVTEDQLDGGGPITGFRACIIECHATVENMTKNEWNECEIKVGIKNKDTGNVAKVDYSRFGTMDVTEGTCTVTVDGKSGTGDVVLDSANSVGSVTCFTFLTLNPTKTYEIFGNAILTRGNTGNMKVILASVRGFFLS